MLTPHHIRSMRDEMQKLSTRSTQGEHEEMTRARFKQTMKDLPIVIGGSALGYGLGRTLGDLGAKKLVKNEAGREQVRKWAPMVGSVLSSAGAYTLGQQRAIMAERRDAAQETADKKTKKKTASIASWEAKNALRGAGLGAIGGAGSGALVGGLASPEGSRLRGAGIGAGVGAVGGAVGGAGLGLSRGWDFTPKKAVQFIRDKAPLGVMPDGSVLYGGGGPEGRRDAVAYLGGLGALAATPVVAGGVARRQAKKTAAETVAAHITTNSPRFSRTRSHSVRAQDTESKPVDRTTATMG